MREARLILAECESLARGDGADELMLGEVLLRLFDGDRLLQLGFARQVDYARERLGVAPRTMYRWLRLARKLASRPSLRRAVIGGAVSASKALVVAPVARGGEEERWVGVAMRVSLGELERRVRGAGSAPAPDPYEFDSVILDMTEPERRRVDVAMTVAELVVGPGTPRWQRLEAMCMEWLGEHAGGDGVGSGGAEARRRRALAAANPPPRAPRASAAESIPSTEGIPGEVPAASSATRPLAARGSSPRDARSLDARARALLAQRRGREERLGRLLRRIRDERLHREAGYRWFETYCRERLGMAPRSVRERLWLETRLDELPALREAYAAGRMPRTKVTLIARAATPADVDERIAEACATTWQQLDRQERAEEDRRDRAAGRYRVWGPLDAAETMALALGVARAWLRSQTGESATDGAALAAMADHFVVVWAPQLAAWRATRSRKEVMLRHGGVCGVPGCSRPAQHEHHVVFRSHGGGDERENRVALCAAHHLHGVHRGYLAVQGVAGRRLLWTVPATGDAWETRGADDVRRVARPPGPAGSVRRASVGAS
jgi:hypothetical protein